MKPYTPEKLVAVSRYRRYVPTLSRELQSDIKKYVSQTRKPEGFLGKMMLSGMNNGHARMADWGLSHLPVLTPEQIEAALRKTGFSEVSCDHHPSKPWITVIAQK